MTREKPPVATLPEDDVRRFDVEDPETLGGQVLDYLDHEGGGLMSRDPLTWGLPQAGRTSEDAGNQVRLGRRRCVTGGCKVARLGDGGAVLFDLRVVHSASPKVMRVGV
jgi:hypothetical protein